MKRKIMVITIVLSLICLAVELYQANHALEIERNSYGEGEKTEVYEMQAEDPKIRESVEIEIGEREYTKEEIQDIFQKVSEELEQLMLGDNESVNHVESNLNLVTAVDGYPVIIQWESDDYSVIAEDGTVHSEEVPQEGKLVELRATLSYGEETHIFAQVVCVYPCTRTNVEQFLYDIGQSVKNEEESTRTEETFQLPQEWNGTKISWKKKMEHKWFFLFCIGGVTAILLWYREKERKRQEILRRKEQLMREYPGMVSKFVMLLSTGITVRQAFEKMVQNYDIYKEKLGIQIAYEEMKKTLREMQGGIAESEAYERFGKRCGGTNYLKFGAMLSQNLRKGSQGICELLNAEAIQAFEDRKARAKQYGEEASAKLMLPMVCMLLVVLLMIMIPAFLGMQF